MGHQGTRAASARLWSVPRPSGTAQMSPLTKKEWSAYSHWISPAAELALKILQELGTQTQFLQAQPATLWAKGKEEKKLEVHWLNKKSLQDHLTLWPKLITKSEYAIPLPRPHVMVQQCYQAPLLTYLSRVAKGRGRRELHKYMYT